MSTFQSREAGLWRRGLGGDADAFGEIFDLHKDRVFRHAYRFLGDRHDAEDVTATAFLELWRRREMVRVVDGSVLPWLLVTANNAAANTRRSTGRYRAMLDGLPRGESPPSAEEQALALAAPLSTELQQAMEGLDPTGRSLVTLVVIEGYPISEAAEALGLSPGAARTRLSRIKGRLRVALASEEIPEAAPASASGPAPGLAPASVSVSGSNSSSSSSSAKGEAS